LAGAGRVAESSQLSLATASAKFLAAIHERTGEAGVAGKVEMDVAGEDVAIVVSLLALITAAGSQLVAARGWFVAADLRLVEEMSASAPAGTKKPAGGFDLDVCELERGWHSRAERQDPAERVDGVPDA
jgi:hypothetical protein